MQPVHESNWDNYSNSDHIPVHVSQEVWHSQGDDSSVDAPSIVETNVVGSPTKASCLDGIKGISVLFIIQYFNFFTVNSPKN